jgi:hypothetical protein
MISPDVLRIFCDLTFYNLRSARSMRLPSILHKQLIYYSFYVFAAVNHWCWFCSGVISSCGYGPSCRLFGSEYLRMRKLPVLIGPYEAPIITLSPVASQNKIILVCRHRNSITHTFRPWRWRLHVPPKRQQHRKNDMEQQAKNRIKINFILLT